MTWWAWLLLWAALVAGAAAVFFLIGRRLWRGMKALTSELGAAADRFSAVSDQLAGLEGPRVHGGDPFDSVGSPGAGPQRPGRRPLR